MIPNMIILQKDAVRQPETPREAARIIRRLVKEDIFTPEEIASRIDMPVEWVKEQVGAGQRVPPPGRAPEPVNCPFCDHLILSPPVVFKYDGALFATGRDRRRAEKDVNCIMCHRLVRLIIERDKPILTVKLGNVIRVPDEQLAMLGESVGIHTGIQFITPVYMRVTNGQYDVRAGISIMGDGMAGEVTPFDPYYHGPWAGGVGDSFNAAMHELIRDVHNLTGALWA